MGFVEKKSGLWGSVQPWLIPDLEDELGELDGKHKEFIAVCELCDPASFMGRYSWRGNGCPPANRLPLFKAFVAKAMWNFPTTAALIDALRHRSCLRRLCGWETSGGIPSEATFSRTAKQFAKDALPQIIHAAMIKVNYAVKMVGHLCIDGTAIEQREKAADNKPKPEPTDAKKKKKRGRKRKDDPPAPPPEPTRIERQLGRSLEENIADLPCGCDWGCKANSQGKTEQWKGGKLHIAVSDGDVPLGFILSSASMHDSQAAIPLMQMVAANGVTSLYDLADAAYDAKGIREMSARLGHVAIIDSNPRGGEKVEFSPAEKVRYRERSSVERVNSHLHDNHGGRTIRVKGHMKVAAHLAFGMLVIAAEQILTMLC